MQAGVRHDAGLELHYAQNSRNVPSRLHGWPPLACYSADIFRIVCENFHLAVDCQPKLGYAFINLEHLIR